MGKAVRRAYLFKGVDAICIWLSENDLQCGCDQCQALGEFAAETPLGPLLVLDVRGVAAAAEMVVVVATPKR